MKNPETVEIGDLCIVTLLDHCVNSPDAEDTDPVFVRVFGSVKEIYKSHIVLYTWKVESGSEDIRDGNSETVTVVRGAIEDIAIVRRVVKAVLSEDV